MEIKNPINIVIYSPIEPLFSSTPNSKLQIMLRWQLDLIGEGQVHLDENGNHYEMDDWNIMAT